jgi:hypothetical protein
MERKIVFVPGVLFGDAARAFEQSGIALDYALPERLRDWDGGRRCGASARRRTRRPSASGSPTRTRCARSGSTGSCP